MKYIGAHVSAAGGPHNAPKNASEIDANAFALFTRNQRSWRSKPLLDDHIAQFKKNCLDANIDLRHILPHASYLINIGCPRENTRNQSIEGLTDELRRAEQLGLHYVNFHPGAHLKMIEKEQCFDLIAEAMTQILGETEYASLVIENTAGQGSHVGYCFEDIAAIIERVDNKSRVGVCLDTCHLFASGYDIRSERDWNDTMEQFDRIVGLRYLKGMHLNDSKCELRSRVDRHHSIGEGHIGREPFRHLMRDKRLDDMPLILETIEPALWKNEVAMLRAMEN